MKVIQIVKDNATIFGLGDDGKLYYFNTSMNDWSLYNA